LDRHVKAALPTCWRNVLFGHRLQDTRCEAPWNFSPYLEKCSLMKHRAKRDFTEATRESALFL
jgi:hypothetical protein